MKRKGTISTIHNFDVEGTVEADEGKGIFYAVIRIPFASEEIAWLALCDLIKKQ